MSDAVAPSISLIVCTYERPEAVGRLLKALMEPAAATPDEILIVDSSFTTQTEEVVNALRGGSGAATLRFFRVGGEHRGLTAQRNFGIAQAGGEVVAFLDDDTVPSERYFEEIGDCFRRHPDAVGVGGYITGAAWSEVGAGARRSLGKFLFDGWERRDDVRWVARRLLGLAPRCKPGEMPPSGHGRPVGFLPPDGLDHEVEFVMGGASAWRRVVFDRCSFSPEFAGYGLYEDLDFCIQANRVGPIYLCTRAEVAHEHDPGARPDPFAYGKMVVRNGWYVWRKRWPSPSTPDKLRWWATTFLLALFRLGDVRPGRGAAFREGLGRVYGAASLLASRGRLRGEWNE